MFCLGTLQACNIRPLYDDKTTTNNILHNIYVEMPDGRLGQIVYNYLYPYSQTNRDSAGYILRIKIRTSMNKELFKNTAGEARRMFNSYRVAWTLTKTNNRYDVYSRGYFNIEKVFKLSDDIITSTVSKENDLKILGREIGRLLISDIETSKIE